MMFRWEARVFDFNVLPMLDSSFEVVNHTHQHQGEERLTQNWALVVPFKQAFFPPIEDWSDPVRISGPEAWKPSIQLSDLDSTKKVHLL